MIEMQSVMACNAMTVKWCRSVLLEGAENSSMSDWKMKSSILWSQRPKATVYRCLNVFTYKKNGVLAWVGISDLCNMKQISNEVKKMDSGECIDYNILYEVF